MFEQIYGMYFSGTGTSKKIVNTIGCKISKLSKKRYEEIDFSVFENREKIYKFDEKDLLIIGLPTYAGRVPNLLLSFLNSIQGHGSLAVTVVMYGNRNFDDALIELRNIMESDGFKVLAAGAFVGEHSFSYELAKGRPDSRDLLEAEGLSLAVYDKIMKSKYDINDKKINLSDKLFKVVDRGECLRPYYKPRDRNGTYINILKVKPKVNNLCNDCKKCAEICPLQAIDYNDVSKYTGICMKCGACIKGCPSNARYYDDEGFLYHKHELEEEYKENKQNRIYID